MTANKDRCPCGGIILADTEDWKVPLCYECFKCHEPSYYQGRADALEAANILVEALKQAHSEEKERVLEDLGNPSLDGVGGIKITTIYGDAIEKYKELMK